MRLLALTLVALALALPASTFVRFAVWSHLVVRYTTGA
jgi:hypothetical protein